MSVEYSIKTAKGRRKKVQYPVYAEKVINRLEERGYEAYIVGGSVRDLLLGKEPHDYDVTTSALPEQTLNVFSDFRTIPTGLAHGTVTVISDGEPIEVTTFRVDGEYLDCRRPESVNFTDDITADLSRRDFTVNAMAYSKKRGIVDAFGGRDDLSRRVIRAVGEPRLRFSEDALRIMRAFRFSAQLDFSIDEATLSAAYDMKAGLSKIATERIASEFIRTVCSPSPEDALRLMSEGGIFEYITGDYTPTAELINALGRSKPLSHVRLGILLSPLKKEGAREVLSALKLSNKLISEASRIAAALSEGQLEGSPADARRFIGSLGTLTEDALDAARVIGILDPDFEASVRRSIEKKECSTGSELAINGGDLVKLGAKGREVGEILAYLLERVIEDPSRNEREILCDIASDKLKK